jgi:signal transduction histidine kinase
VATDRSFAQVVSLACHDLRTPLATVHGFARTIERLEVADERTARYIGLIVDGSGQVVDLLERLALVARIERGVYEPALRGVDLLELSRTAAASVDVGAVAVSGTGADVEVDPVQTERSP